MPRHQKEGAPTDLSTPIGRRVAVVGGGGKSTLARAISTKTGVKHIELDAIHWMPNWTMREPGEMKSIVRRILSEEKDGWVADGNYFQHLGDLVLRSAETVIFVNMPWAVMFWRILLRSAHRIRDKRQICGNNYENLRLAFMSKDSLLLWHIQNIRKYGKRRQQ